MNISIGDRVRPDGWNHTGWLTAGNSYSDSSFPGCEFYLTWYSRLTNPEYEFRAVNVKITGRKYTRVNGDFGYRCQIEFVGDGEASTIQRGWIFPK